MSYRITIPIALMLLLGPASFACAQELRIEQTEQALTVLRGDKSILVYNIQPPPAPDGIDKVFERTGFLHPVTSPAGSVLTATYPIDHAHQSGIFAAWVKTTYKERVIDFWNLAGKTGRVSHEKVVGTNKHTDGSVSFQVDLLHRIVAEPQVDVLHEHWTVTVKPTDGSYYLFDIETTQEAITDEPLVIEKYHYGGVAYRGSVRWLLPTDGGKSKQEIEPNTMVNNLGQDRIEGNHAHTNWVSNSGELGGKPAGLVMLSHPRNFRAPQAARLHPTKPYFVYSPCVDGQFKIDREHPYHAQYRFLVTDKLTDAKWIDQQWQTWITAAKP